MDGKGFSELNFYMDMKNLIPIFTTFQVIFRKILFLIYEIGWVELPGGYKEALSNNNFILRGCSLRNTRYVYGVVSYTGHWTKIMMNSVNSR